MADLIAVLNAGSSSLKFALFRRAGGGLEPEARGEAAGLYTQARFSACDPAGHVLSTRAWPDGVTLGHEGALAHLLEFVRGDFAAHRLVGVGHRVVHGGLRYTQPVRLSAPVIEDLASLIPLAPLHQPHNLAPARLLLAQSPQLPQVACFDTAFHVTNPPLARRFALPQALHEAGVQRYGFHGLSYEYIASVLPSLDADAAAGRCIVLHLGNGASLCALLAGRSIASTMGFSTLDGIPMGTRSGSLDPGVLLYLMSERGLDGAALERLLYFESGLLGVSGISSDMQTLLASRDPRAALAVDLQVYRIARELGSLAAALGGLDAIVFTAGIGEHSPLIRERVGRGAAWLGVEIDPAANARGLGRISTASSRISAWVIPTNEELVIARETLMVLDSD